MVTSQVITDDISTAILLAFVKEHLPKTQFWDRGGIKFYCEQFYAGLERWEVIEIINRIIGQELGLYFSIKSNPDLHIGNNSADVVASSIAVK